MGRLARFNIAAPPSAALGLGAPCSTGSTGKADSSKQSDPSLSILATKMRVWLAVLVSMLALHCEAAPPCKYHSGLVPPFHGLKLADGANASPHWYKPYQSHALPGHLRNVEHGMDANGKKNYVDCNPASCDNPAACGIPVCLGLTRAKAYSTKWIRMFGCTPPCTKLQQSAFVVPNAFPQQGISASPYSTDLEAKSAASRELLFESGASNHAVTTWSSPPDTRECEDLNKAAQSIPTLCAVIGNEHCAHVRAATTKAMARCNDETGGLGEDQSGTLAAVVKSETEFGRAFRARLRKKSAKKYAKKPKRKYAKKPKRKYTKKYALVKSKTECAGKESSSNQVSVEACAAKCVSCRRHHGSCHQGFFAYGRKSGRCSGSTCKCLCEKVGTRCKQVSHAHYDLYQLPKRKYTKKYALVKSKTECAGKESWSNQVSVEACAAKCAVGFFAYGRKSG